MKHIKILGISAGQGALLHPFLNQKGCKILGNIEPRGVFHTPKENQWKLNFVDIPFIREGLIEGIKPNVIVSSPDCGASSIMRLSKVKQLGKPEENKSLNLVINGILYYKPKVFLIENLPRLLSLVSREFFEKTFKDYDLLFHELSVSEFGNSQVSRKRLVIIGVKKDTSRVSKKQFIRVFKVNTPKLTRDCLKPAYFKSKNDNYMPPLNKVLAMYDYRKLPEKKNLTVGQIHELWNKDFKDEKKWPIKTAKMSTLPGVYRLEANKYPLTVRPADRQFRPDGFPLGIQDFKTLMGFPEEYKIYMDKSSDKSYLYWLNKARYTLCKGSVYEVGLWFRNCLYNINF
jgi:site-specific DNA-cytosine methylase